MALTATPEVRSLLSRIMQYMESRNLSTVDCAVRDFAHAEAETVVMTFREASAIDEQLCGFRGNTHWMEAYNFPDEGQVIQGDDASYEAHDCAIYTFKLV